MNKILGYHIENKEEILKIIAPLKIKLVTIESKDLTKNLGSLIGTLEDDAEEYQGIPPKESFLIFCGVSEKHLNKVLSSLREKQIKIDFKAILTPTNEKWPMLDLLIELERERKEFEKMESENKK